MNLFFLFNKLLDMADKSNLHDLCRIMTKEFMTKILQDGSQLKKHMNSYLYFLDNEKKGIVLDIVQDMIEASLAAKDKTKNLEKIVFGSLNKIYELMINEITENYLS